jgi:nitrogenase molybdenum-iron protein alpha/beta subunit
MSGSSTSTFPDSISGIIFAFEGIDRACVLLNGPTGCKYYHGAISDAQRTRRWGFDPIDFPATLFFGQPRVPTTYLDSRDYVFGSREKLDEALAFLREHVDFDVLAVVNSPGAALIGDDLHTIVSRALPDRRFVTVQTPGFSSDLCHGFQVGIQALFDQLDLDWAEKPTGGRAPVVNLLGLSIYQRYHEGDFAELKRLLGLCGIEVNCALGQTCDLESIARVPAADANVVVHPEYGLETAGYLRERFGTPTVELAGAPIGFGATDEFVHAVCDAVGADPAPYDEASGRARARAYTFISKINSTSGLPKGVRYSVEGTCSEMRSYVRFLTEYLGMAPMALENIAPRSTCRADELRAYLEGIGFEDALDEDIEKNCGELVFGSGATISRLKAEGLKFTGVETAQPSIGYVDVLPKTHLGLTGALMIVEQVLNGL